MKKNVFFYNKVLKNRKNDNVKILKEFEIFKKLGFLIKDFLYKSDDRKSTKSIMVKQLIKYYFLKLLVRFNLKSFFYKVDNLTLTNDLIRDLTIIKIYVALALSFFQKLMDLKDYFKQKKFMILRKKQNYYKVNYKKIEKKLYKLEMFVSVYAGNFTIKYREYDKARKKLFEKKGGYDYEQTLFSDLLVKNLVVIINMCYKYYLPLCKMKGLLLLPPRMKIKYFFFNKRPKQLNFFFNFQKLKKSEILLKSKKQIDLLKLSLLKKKIQKYSKTDIYLISSKFFFNFLLIFNSFSLKLSFKLIRELKKRDYLFIRACDYLFLKNIYNLYILNRNQISEKDLFLILKKIILLNFYFYKNKVIYNKKKKKYQEIKKKIEYALCLKKTLNNLFAYIYNINTKKIKIMASLGQSGLKGPAKFSQVASEFLGKYIADQCRKFKIKEVILILNTKVDYYVRIFLKGFFKMSVQESQQNFLYKNRVKSELSKAKIFPYNLYYVPTIKKVKNIRIKTVFFMPKIAHNGNRLKNARRC